MSAFYSRNLVSTRTVLIVVIKHNEVNELRQKQLVRFTSLNIKKNEDEVKSSSFFPLTGTEMAQDTCCDVHPLVLELAPLLPQHRNTALRYLEEKYVFSSCCGYTVWTIQGPQHVLSGRISKTAWSI